MSTIINHEHIRVVHLWFDVSTKALQIVLITINDAHKKQTLYFI